MTDWTDEITAHAVTLSHAGKSRAEIASILNQVHGTSFTRNAIIGRLNRAKVQAQPQRMRPPNRPVLRVVKADIKADMPKAPKPVYLKLAEVKPMEDRFKLSIMELTKDTCRYTKDGKHYCGDKIVQVSYCAEHLALCYKVPKVIDKINRA